MRRFVIWWVRKWRSLPFEVPSPLPAEAASHALARSVTGYGSVKLSKVGFKRGPRIVTGTVTDNYVRLEARRSGKRDPWEPVLIGRLVPAPYGSVLVGQLDVRQLGKIISVAWLGFGAYVFDKILLGAVVELLRGDLSKAALQLLESAGLALGSIAFFIGMTALSFKKGDKDAAFLQQWVAGLLHAPDGMPPDPLGRHAHL